MIVNWLEFRLSRPTVSDPAPPLINLVKSDLTSLSLSVLIGKRALTIPISQICGEKFKYKALADETGQINISCCSHCITIVIDTFEPWNITKPK